MPRGLAQAAGNVLRQPLALILLQDLPEVADLRVVIVALTMVVPRSRLTRERQCTILVRRIFLGTAFAVRLVVHAAAAVIVKAHRAVTVIGVDRAPWPVYRQ